MSSENQSREHECEHCGASFDSTYAWEVHILAECSEATQDHKEWINGGELA